MTSIIEESKRARTNGFGFWRNKKFIIGIAVILVLGGGYYFWPKGEKKNQSEQVTQKNYTVKKGDIKIAVDAEGKVVAEDGVELSFSLNDDNLEVKEVYVKEGDQIKKGDKIASVETDDLQLSLNSAWDSYQSALATYNETIDGATDDDIADAKDKITSAEISLEQARQSLEDTKQSNETAIYNAEKAVKDAKEDLDKNKNREDSEDIRDAYEDMVDDIKAINISLDSILRYSDNIIGVDNKLANDDFEADLGAKVANTLFYAQGTYKTARDSANDLNVLAIGLNRNSDFDDIDDAVELTEQVLSDFEEHLYKMKLMLDASNSSTNLSESTLSGYKSNIATNRTTINTKITTINTNKDAIETAEEGLDDYEESYTEAKRDLDEAKADAERSLFNAEASVKNKEITLDQAKRDLEDLTAPLTDSEMASARSKLTSASISLQKARNSYDDATLVSPIDGQVVELNYKPGDIIVDNDNPFAVILNSDTLFITVDAEEADVSKLAVGQKASAVFDALDELELTGEISFISLTSNTSNNGIVTYEVRVLINNPEGKQIREGMTAQVAFIATEVKDVLMIPVSAVRNVEGKPSVMLKSREWKAVTTGFTDGKYVEVIAGLAVGEEIVY